MKVQMDTGKDGALCLRLVAETKDERRILAVLDEAVLNTVQANEITYGYLVSKPMSLKEPAVTPGMVIVVA